jgi:3'-phosphoadenosine 5'-phosphosulfate sulfotransferase (PAPS reductase)/FAD synthetase
VAPGIDVIFLDTGYHFVETIGTRDAVKLVHNVNVINVTPEQTVAEQDATWGKDMFARDPDLCCSLRKVAPARQGAGTLRRLGHRGAACRFIGPARTRLSWHGTRLGS